MKTTSQVGIVVVSVMLLAPVLVFTAWRIRVSGLTARVEKAGGFVGSVQPPDWMNLVYDLVCRLELFCEPYQIILDRDDAVETAITAAQGLRHLRILEIEDTNLTQHTLDEIKMMRQLRHLEFRRCTLPPGAADELRGAMRTVEIVEKD